MLEHSQAGRLWSRRCATVAILRCAWEPTLRLGTREQEKGMQIRYRVAKRCFEDTLADPCCHRAKAT
jgi:hypothetical protein